MPTIENGSGSTRSEMKKEILDEIHHEERRRRMTGCLVGLLIKLTLLLIPVVLVAVVIAKSGFYEIPLLSQWLYHPSAPQRVVQPLVGYDGEQVMKAAVARAKFEAGAGLLTIDLSEVELTTLADAALINPDKDSAGGSVLPLKTVQMTVSPDGIELFAVTPRDNRDVTFKVLFNPSITEGGELDLAVKQVRIGSLDMPKFLLNLVSKALASQLSREFMSAASGAGKLEAVRAGEKALYLDFRPELKLPFIK